MQNIRNVAEALGDEVGKIIVGKRDSIELILASVLCGGHVLLEDLPGSGKTTLVKALSIALGCTSRRIQFTPDLLPSDVVGTSIYNRKTEDFTTVLGPVCTNILLADEINRALPRTQAALLEAMEERQVTIDGKTYPLPEPFFVMATQNPIEKESTFALPAAEMDRFFIKLSLGYPEGDEEIEMLKTIGDGTDFSKVKAVTSPEELMGLRKDIEGVYIDGKVMAYIVDIVQGTRSNHLVSAGASPRASKYLYQGGKAVAAMNGRDYVIPEDIQKLLLPVLSHRVRLSSEARIRKVSVKDVIEEIIEKVPVPPTKEQMV
ncbi:MAG: MoxR family ATPase [Spirochaetales bacterium]|nr:MoxR family ATPase [Spirochaetales bacterium]